MATVNLGAGVNHTAHVPIVFLPVGQAYTLKVGLYSDVACATVALASSAAVAGTGNATQVTLNTPSFAFPNSLGIVYVGVVVTVGALVYTFPQASTNNVNMTAGVTIGVVTWDQT